MTQSMSVTAVRPGRIRRPGFLRGVSRVLVPSLFALAWPLSAAAQAPLALGAVSDSSAAGPDAPAAVDKAEEELAALVAHAMTVHPAIRAAQDRVEASRAAISPAGALPDPMLGVGITNLPVADPGFEGPMTMAMVGVGQLFPYPGKLDLRRRVAEAELAASNARLDAARWAVEQEVKNAYYELAYLDQALGVVRNNETLLTNFIRVTEARYGVGTGGQQDILKARVESARLAEEAVMLSEQRRAALARLNAALDRSSDTPVEQPRVPTRVARAAVAENPSEIRFASATLGARALNSPLPSLTEMQETAVRESPMLRAHQAMIAAQAAQLDLLGKAHLPDFNVSLQYGQSGEGGLVSAMVSVPVPLRKARVQDAQVKEAQAQLSALQAEHHAKANELRAEVAAAYAALEKDRAQLGLFAKSIIPQGRASLESATAGFQVGRNDFLTLLDNQTTLYNYETAYFRSLTGFAQGLAELERTVGKEILR
jgi:cobalt-zinc-cadmium efflux system outer membrane protein